MHSSYAKAKASVANPGNVNTAEVEHLRLLVEELKSTDDRVRVSALARALGGVTVLLKGASDMVSSGKEVYVVEEDGSNRR